MTTSAKTLIIIRLKHLGMIISEGESLFNLGSTSVFAAQVHCRPFISWMSIGKGRTGNVEKTSL